MTSHIFSVLTLVLPKERALDSKYLITNTGVSQFQKLTHLNLGLSLISQYERLGTRVSPYTETRSKGHAFNEMNTL